MAEHNELGKQGEEMAVAHLKKKGFAIIETNWRFGKDEIDIIASNKDNLVIVEVKTRSSAAFGEPAEFVNKNKQRFLVRAAQCYVERKNIPLEVRFDIVSIILSKTKEELTHLENAFYPVL